MRRNGFTLVELIIVIIILGILAALAIPQFTTSTRDAKQAVAESNLAMLREAIQRYYYEHNSTYPDGGIAEQLTQYTDADGKTSEAMDRALYPYGPYIERIPENPMSGLKKDKAIEIDAVNIAGPLAPDPSKKVGWRYSRATGEIIPNS